MTIVYELLGLAILFLVCAWVLFQAVNGTTDFRQTGKFVDEGRISMEIDDQAPATDDMLLIPTYDRKGIVIPDYGEDTKKCDETHTVCDLSEGENFACFFCIESRQSLRYCVAIPKSVIIPVIDDRADSQAVTYLRFEATPEGKGYCLTRSLKYSVHSVLIAEGIIDENQETDETVKAISESRRRCSPKNANWILSRKNINKNTTYNFICYCKYPHLLINVSGPMTECAKSVGCNFHGTLDPDSIAGRIDPFLEGKCICDKNYESHYDAELTGPSCVAGYALANFDRFDCSKKGNDLPIENEAVNPDFRDRLIQMIGRSDICLSNPCTEGGSKSCVLRIETLFNDTEQKIALCASKYTARDSTLFLAVRRDYDYLLNNGGRYPNACLDVTGVDMGSFAAGFHHLPGPIITDTVSLISPNLCNDENVPRNIGVYIKLEYLRTIVNHDDIPEYKKFIATLKGLDNWEKTGIVWTYNRTTRRAEDKVDDSSFSTLWPSYTASNKYTVGVTMENGVLWSDRASVTRYFVVDRYKRITSPCAVRYLNSFVTVDLLTPDGIPDLNKLSISVFDELSCDTIEWDNAADIEKSSCPAFKGKKVLVPNEKHPKWNHRAVNLSGRYVATNNRFGY